MVDQHDKRMIVADELRKELMSYIRPGDRLLAIPMSKSGLGRRPMQDAEIIVIACDRENKTFTLMFKDDWELKHETRRD